MQRMQMQNNSNLLEKKRKMNRSEKLAQLSKKRQESILLNKKSVTQEYVDKKTNNKLLVKQERKKDEALELLQEKTALESGIDYDRIKNLEYTVEDVERWNQKQLEKKELADDGFTGNSHFLFFYSFILLDYIQLAAKAYNRSLKKLQPKKVESSSLDQEKDPIEASFKAFEHHPTEESKDKLSKLM